MGLRLRIFDELAERGDAVRLADDVGMKPEIHDPPGRGALQVKLVEGELQHLDPVARRQAIFERYVERLQGTQTIGPCVVSIR